jgi:ankyrin repeat protein
MEIVFKAIREGDEMEVAKLLDADPGLLEKANHEGDRPFVVAARNRQLGVVKLLMSRGADVNATGASGMTALHGAACGDDEEMAAFLLGQGAKANSTVLGDKTPLMLAYFMGHVGVVRVFIQHIGTNVLEETDEQGWRALHWVAHRGHEAVATFLLDQGAQANSRDTSGRTPLMLACKEGRLAVVGVLLRHVGLQALEEANEAGMTALHLAALWGHGDVVAFLLEQGAETDRRDNLHMTPLMAGCSEGRLGVARMLLEHMGEGALQEADAIGRTALHLAASGGHEELTAFLLSEGARANSRDDLEQTPLMWACTKGHLGVVRMLAQHMGEEGLKEQSREGKTPLHLAASNGHEKVVRNLLLAGADPTITDNKGRTPLALAERRERAGCVTAFKVRTKHVCCTHTAPDPFLY